MCFEGCGALCERLRRNDPSLTVVNLNHRNIGNDGAKALAAALAYNTRVVVLFLQHNSIGASGMKALAKALLAKKMNATTASSSSSISSSAAAPPSLSSPLAHLYLDDNHLGDEGCHAIATIIQSCASLQVLKLTDNQIGPTGVQILMQALLSSTSSSSSQSSSSSSSSLQYLSLQKNNLGKTGMHILTQALATQKNGGDLVLPLRWLDVRCNKVHDWKTVLQEWICVLRDCRNETLSVLELWETSEWHQHYPDTDHYHHDNLGALYEELQFWLHWNRAGRRSLRCTNDTSLPVSRLLANAAADSRGRSNNKRRRSCLPSSTSPSPDVLWATLQARPDLVVPKHS